MKKELAIAVMTEVAKTINGTVVRSNDPTNKANNILFKPLVYLVQTACDKILANVEITILERLLLCGYKVMEFEAGNCMLQAFAVYNLLIKKFIELKEMTAEMAVPLAICTTSDHTFVLVDDYLVCDPWTPYVGPLDKSPYAGQRLSNYFSIDKAWNCASKGRSDPYSTLYTYTLMGVELPGAAVIESDDSDRPTEMKI